MMNSKYASLITSFWPIYPANTLVVTGTIVTCVCFLGVLGALKENRCLLVSVSLWYSHIGFLKTKTTLEHGNSCMFETDLVVCADFQFFLLLFILMLVELAMGCVFLVYDRKVYTHTPLDPVHFSLDSNVNTSSVCIIWVQNIQYNATIWLHRSVNNSSVCVCIWV